MKRHYINYQHDGVSNYIETRVSTPKEFEKWSHQNIKRGLYVVLPGENAKEVFITSSLLDIQLFFESVFIGGKLFIQRFEYGDYKEAFAYLKDLFEIEDDSIPKVTFSLPN